MRLIEDQETVSTLSAINAAELLCHPLDENSRSLTPDPNKYLLILVIQIFNHLRKDLRYDIRPLNGKKIIVCIFLCLLAIKN